MPRRNGYIGPKAMNVMFLLCKGLNQKQIARAMGLNHPHNVGCHTANARLKYGAHTTEQAVLLWYIENHDTPQWAALEDKWRSYLTSMPQYGKVLDHQQGAPHDGDEKTVS